MSDDLEQLKNSLTELQQQMQKVASENKKLQIQFGSSTKLIKELNDFIQILLNLSPFGVCIIQEEKLIFANKAFAEIPGFSQKQLRNMNPADIVYEEDRDHLRKSVIAMLKGEAKSFFMFRVMTSSETIKWVLGSVALIHMNDKEAIVGNFADLTEGRVMQLAYSDPLTGLPNRKLLMDRLGQAIVSSKRRKSRLALLFIDLDSFKEVNDTRGHEVGDKLLIEVAQKLKESIKRENDTVARIGGDEFLILLTDVLEINHIEIVISHIYDNFREPLSIDSLPFKIKVNLSIGVALFPEHGEDCDILIRNADTAMYVVKKLEGKNNFHFFDT